MEKKKFTFLKFLAIVGIVAWTIAGLTIHYFEINHYYTKRHSVVENILNPGIVEGFAMCLKKETQQQKMQAISQQKDHSLKIRGNRSATCLAMGTVFRETEPKVGESHTKFHPMLMSFILLLVGAGAYKVFTKKKEFTFSFWNIVLLYFGIFALYAMVSTGYANVSYGSGKMAADVLERTTGVPGITHAGGFTSGLKVTLHYLIYVLRQVFVVLVAYAAGASVYTKLLKDNQVNILNFAVKTMIGFYFIFLFSLVVTHFSGFTTPVVWIASLSALWLGRKQLGNLWTTLANTKITITARWATIAMIAAILLLIAIYQFQVIRPIPIGWDAVRTYMNNAKMMDQFSMRLPGYGVGNLWTVIMSLGFVLWDSDAAAISYSSMAGLLFLLTFGGMMAVVLKKEYRDRIIPFVLLGFIQMPLFFFHMAQDDKIDMAVLFSSAVAVIGLYKYIKSGYDWRYGLLAGVTTALTVMVKKTAIIMLAPIVITLVWYCYGMIGTAGTVVLFSGLIALRTKYIADQIAWILIPIGLLVIGYVVATRFKYVKETISRILLYIVGFLVLFIPVNIHNMIVAGELSYKEAKRGGERISAEVNVEEAYPKLKDVYVKETGDAANAELGRYIGFEKGHFKYSTFLVDVFTNRHQFGTYVTVSALVFTLIPLLVFAMPLNRPWITRGILAALAVLYAKLSFFPGDALRAQLESLSSIPSMVITLFLFLTPLAVIALSAKRNKDIPIFTFATLVAWLVWLVAASGVIWYGISAFIGVFIILALLLQSSLEQGKKAVWYAALTTLFVCTFTSALGNEKMNTELYGFIDFKTAERSAKVSADNNLKIVRGIADVMNREEESKIWAMGTSIKYHVDKNIARYYHDDTVDRFSFMTADISSEDITENQQLISKRMYDLGFRYFLLDLNIHTIDRTPEKSLTKKFKRALEFTRENPWLQVIGTDVGKRARPRVIAYEILDPSVSKDQLQKMREAAGEGKSITMIRSSKGK